MKKIIEIIGLTFSYPDSTKALSGVDMEVFEGETLGIVGPNGAGKSTLLLHLNGVLRPQTGSIKISGLEVNDKNLALIREKVGLVFQNADNQLFMPTVFEDVAFGPINMRLAKLEVKKRVSAALREVDMPDSTARLSHHLSMGEKKRIAMATVLSMGPEIIVLDEPSSNLDPRHRRQTINFLKKFKFTKVIASHDLDMVFETCGRVALLDKGRIVALGSCATILKDKDLLESHGLELPCSYSER